MATNVGDTRPESLDISSAAEKAAVAARKTFGAAGPDGTARKPVAQLADTTATQAAVPKPVLTATADAATAPTAAMIASHGGVFGTDGPPPAPPLRGSW